MLRLLKRTALGIRLKAAWRHEIDEAMKPVRKELRTLTRDVEQLRAALLEASTRAARGDTTASRLKLILELNEQQQDVIARLPTLLDEPRIIAHVRRSIAAAEMRSDPLDHIVVDHVLPDDVYELLLTAIPPAVFFEDRDPIKRDLSLPVTSGPALITRVWNFVDEVIARRAIQPAVLERFHGPLQEHFDQVFGAAFRERANLLPYRPSGGRLMLRLPGYHLSPHRDPKRSMMTCLLYLARPGQSDVHGTQLFRIRHDEEANYKQTYYPEANGHECELATVVPFRPNTMLVFLNSRGAHGATIPADAGRDLERYSYQFYVAPEQDALVALLKQLPPDRQIMWQNKNRVTGVSPRERES